VNEAAVQELLSYAVFPDPDRLTETVAQYRNDPDLRLYGLEEDGVLIGLIGYALAGNRLDIRHLAVEPEFRRQGYGRGLILEAIAKEQPDWVAAETDEEAVEFYRNIGFTIVSLGERFPGAERFLCVYDAREDA
jgi:ribosomal protein S18 acetylase RimI-like enzyme